jgi:hypothetical protein
MKNKIVLTAAFFAASTFSFAEIALTENLSVGGFVDMSYTHSDDDRDDSSDSNNSYQVDQVEITFGLDYGVVTAQIDLQWELDDGSSIDQAFTTYDLGNGFAVTAGNYDSMLGFEAFEAPGLYQVSKAYTSNIEAFEGDGFGSPVDLNIDDIIAPETNNGVKVTYEDGAQFFGVSLQDGGIFGDNRLGGDSDGGGSQILDQLVDGLGVGAFAAESSGYAVEVAYARDLGNGFNVFVGTLMEETEVEVNTIGEASIDTTVINGYVTYETGAWLFASELIKTEHDVEGLGELEIDSFLLMANYTYSDQASVTARISNVDVEDIFDATKLTVAHLYAFTDNLALAVELSSVDYDFEDNNVEDGDTLEAAVELLFTF